MSQITRVALVPAVPALLEEYAGLSDPVAELRSACRKAVTWLVEGGPAEVVVLGDRRVTHGIAVPRSERVARSLLTETGFTGRMSRDGLPTEDIRDSVVLVLANGSACRDELTPSRLDELAAEFDRHLEALLCAGDGRGLRALDAALAGELLADGVPSLQTLGEVLGEHCAGTVDYSDSPFGVQYWVARWRLDERQGACAS
ncbi:MAG: hypothetical protein M3130_12495 [Actinomycetota bacterium]|nr:hypothetical protein [Actinomycetota bacterium]